MRWGRKERKSERGKGIGTVVWMREGESWERGGDGDRIIEKEYHEKMCVYERVGMWMN